MNLLLAFAFWNVDPTFAQVNMVLGVFNLLPFPKSDGRRILDLMRSPAAEPMGRPIARFASPSSNDHYEADKTPMVQGVPLISE